MSDSEANAAPPAARGPTFPPKIIASLLDLTERRLQQLVADGWIPRAQRGQYSLRDSIRGYIRYLKQGSRDQTRGSESARLARAQAIKVEMENFRRMGELAVWSQVDELMRGLIVTMRSLHEAVPGRLANELIGLEAPRIYQRLQTELRRIDDLCADYLEQRAEAFAAVPSPGKAGPPAGEDDADTVGEQPPDDAP